MHAIDEWHQRAVRQPLLQVLAVLTRVLLALAFIPSGLLKVLGLPFTQLPQSDPVGAFFAGFFAAPGYYRFVGTAQMAAAVLLIFPRTATLGACLYLPIAVNIAAITVSIGPSFAMTRVVATGMLLANLCLLAWDWDRLRPILTWRRDTHRYRSATTSVLLFAALALAAQGVIGAHLVRLGGGSYVSAAALLLAAIPVGLLGLRRAVDEVAR